MADVTDAPFRQIIAKYSKPGAPFVFFTEFTSADGLMHPAGHDKLMRELYFTPAEKPIVAQLFSARPEKMYEAAKLVASLGFDGVDINMGCPDKNIEKQGCGAGLIKTPSLAQELIAAAKEGSNLPVSVKTRLGYNKIEIDSWLPAILKARPALLTVHLRTRKEMSKVPARWELMPEVKRIVDGSGVLLLGNGDVTDVADAREKQKRYGMDGVMLGRAIYGNPWLFANSAHLQSDCRIERPASKLSDLSVGNFDNSRNQLSLASQSRNEAERSECDASGNLYNFEAGMPYTPSPRERLEVLLEHINVFDELFGETQVNQELFKGHTKSFAIMKKHFKAYVGEFPGSHDLRNGLLETSSALEAKGILEDFLKKEVI